MPAITVPTPATIVGAGFLYIAPVGSTLPTNTVAGSAFTDTWPVAWLPLGATDEGTSVEYDLNTGNVEAAEFLDPVAVYVTGRVGTVSFKLLNATLTNLQRAINGGIGALAATSGTGATQLTTLTPPAPGSEVRAMIGYESLDSTLRAVFPQCLQGGKVQLDFRKAPNATVVPFEMRLELPTSGTLSGKPFAFYAAGTARG